MSLELERCPNCDLDISQETSVRCPQCNFPILLVAGKYTLQEKIAAGGFGVIYLAHHVHLPEDKERAIKVIFTTDEASQDSYRQFQREVLLTAKLSQQNDHVVRVYDDFGHEPGLGYFYVMEYLRGQTLRQIMKPNRGMADVESHHILHQACQALHDTHAAGIVHRDLKPDNIYILERREDRQYVKLLDFGIAKNLQNRLQSLTSPDGLVETPSKDLVGTPWYMSPEQCEAKPLDGRSDVYALGLILYEMVSGHNPYDLDSDDIIPNPYTILWSHTTKEPTPLSKWRPDLPPGFGEVVLQMLAKDPAERPESVQQVWESLLPHWPPGLPRTPLFPRTSNYAIQATQAYAALTPPEPAPPSDNPVASVSDNVAQNPVDPFANTQTWEGGVDNNPTVLERKRPDFLMDPNFDPEKKS